MSTQRRHSLFLKLLNALSVLMMISRFFVVEKVFFGEIKMFHYFFLLQIRMQKQQNGNEKKNRTRSVFIIYRFLTELTVGNNY